VSGDVRAVRPVAGPLDATVRVPGSKSLTNRALVAAALARGRSTLRGSLRADDTEAMIDCLRSLGVAIEPDWDADRLTIEGCDGRPPVAEAELDCRLSGTTSRFVLPVAALGEGRYRVDGRPPLRARPFDPVVSALRNLSIGVDEPGEPGRLPLVVHGGPLRGGQIELPGDTSSQFVSALLLAGPCPPDGLVVSVGTDLVSRPYVDMTVAVMRAFGAEVHQPDQSTWIVAPTGYVAASYAVEPDASAASYFFAAAAVCGGSVTVTGLGTRSVQGDVRFVDLLEEMGAEVTRTAEQITVTGTGRLSGIDADMTEISDTAQTLAAVAVHADGPTRVSGIGFIRGKETDRIAAVVTELERCGIAADEEPGGFVVHPGSPRPAVIQTYDDHRMAMSFALLGLRADGIEIADPGCVAKTFPGFWDEFDRLVT
jgi:3-phosphoshikimate 1-carboxyvinyltransferase